MEILFFKTPSSVADVSANVRWLNADELPVYNRHLALCGQKTLSAERWNMMLSEETIYCGLFVDGEMVARAAVEKYSEDRWEVADVRTARKYRNLGYAKQICLFVMSYIFRHGRTATMRTEADNEPMLSVIRSLGFEKTISEEQIMIESIRFFRAAASDAAKAAALANKMWSPDEEREKEFLKLIESDEAAVFLAEAGGQAVAFAQCGLRHDYVEGKDSEGPVGYLEGIFVEEAYRGRGIAKMLLSCCEDWAREMGCTEFASDTELHNEEGLRFHLSCGFEEAGRIICFMKKL